MEFLHNLHNIAAFKQPVMLCQPPMSFANAWQEQQLALEFTKLLKRSHGGSKCGIRVLVGRAA